MGERGSQDSPRVVNVVQARLTSKRFPEKVFAALSGRPIIEWIAERTLASSLTSEVVFAVPDTVTNAPLAQYLEELGTNVFRGSEHDVLRRTYLAAQAFEPDIVIRTCADRPLVDPRIIDYTIGEYMSGPADGICFSHRPDGDQLWDFGFGVEVFSFSMLEALAFQARSDAHREHVTLLAYENGTPNVGPAQVPDWLAGLMWGGRRFDVDTLADLMRVQDLVGESGPDVSAESVLERAAWFPGPLQI